MSKKHRNFSDSVKKCQKALQMLSQYDATSLVGECTGGGLCDGIELGTDSETEARALRTLEQRLQPVVAPMLRRCGGELHCGSMYWAGYDRERRPMLWVRPKLKKWRGMDREREVLAHVALIEAGLQLLLPPGVTQFVLVADAAGLGFTHFDASLMRSLLKLMTSSYPDRAGRIYAGPVNALVKSVHSLVKPLLPTAVKSKIVIMDNPTLQMADAIDASALPHFFGGDAAHEFCSSGRTAGCDEEYFSMARMLATQLLQLQRLKQANK